MIADFMRSSRRRLLEIYIEAQQEAVSWASLSVTSALAGWLPGGCSIWPLASGR